MCLLVGLSGLAPAAAQAPNPFTNDGEVSQEAPRARLKPDEIRLTVSEADCRRLVAHQPRGDVAYQPGVDVRGKAVAPAVLPASTDLGDRLLEKEIAFDLALNPLLFAGDPRLETQFGEASVSLGRVEVDGQTGEATLDGEALTDPQTAAIAKACRARMSR